MYMTIIIKELRQAIKEMKRHQPLYYALKEELALLGYWKNKPRGNPRRGYERMIEGNTE